MAILFIGGEMEDFVHTGSVAVNTSTSVFRSAYARMALEPAAQNSGTWTHYSTASFTASTQFWTTARYYNTGSTTAGNYAIGFSATGAANHRIRLEVASGGSSTTLVLKKGDGTTWGTSTATLSSGQKIDIYVSYGASGNVKVYIDNALAIDYSGDTTTSGTASLSQVHLGSLRNSTAVYWSEVIVADESTRPLSVKTLVPDAAGDVTGWTAGAYTDIDDVTAADVDLAVSDTAAQVLAVNCTGMPTGASNLSVRAVKSVVLACRGASGPSKIDIGLRQSSTNGFAASQTLDTGWTAYSATWTANPITSAVFTSSEINSIQLAYRSAT